MTTVTDYFFINVFGATEEEVNALGEKFGVAKAFHALTNVDENLNHYLNGDFNKFERAKIDLFLHEVVDILVENDIDPAENPLQIEIYKPGSRIYAKINIKDPLFKEVQPIMEKAEIEMDLE